MVNDNERVPRLKLFAYCEESQTQSAFSYSLLMAEKKSVTEVVHEWEFRLRVAGVELNEAAIAFGYQITEIKYSNVAVFSGRATAVKLAWVTCEPRTILNVKTATFERMPSYDIWCNRETVIEDSCDLCGKRFRTKRGLSTGICPDCGFVICQDDLIAADGTCRHCKAPIPSNNDDAFCLACRTVKKENEEVQSDR
jgi:hypothetical protein